MQFISLELAMYPSTTAKQFGFMELVSFCGLELYMKTIEDMDIAKKKKNGATN